MRAWAPGRVNLIGDHVDYVGGLVLPMAVDLGTSVTFVPGGDRLRLRSADEPDPVDIPVPVADPASIRPDWGRYVGGVAAEMGLTVGGRGSISSTLPLGAGLSSSASLEAALAVAFGHPGPPGELARLCQRAEQAASGVPCGIMDQLAVAAGVEGAALLIDCRDETVEPVALPAGVAVHAVHSGVPRRLAGSAYAERRAACEAAEGEIGPLRDATPADVDTLDDPVRRRRARHVVTEIARVRAAVDACRRGDVVTVGALMVDSHRSLRDDFEVSIPELDALVERLLAVPGVYGARLTGAGFGGCVVALVDADVPADRVGGWRLRPSGGARLVADGEPEGDR